MFKRGQVTIFVITGLVILLIIGMVYYIRYYSVSGGGFLTSSLEAENVKDYVESCLEETTLKGLIYLGEHGGYYSDKIPYFYKNNISLIEDKEYLGEELNKYIKYNLGLCIKDFYYFDYEIRSGEIKTDSSFFDDKVDVDLSYHLEIVKGEKVYTLDSFNVEVDTNLNEFYDLARFITEDYIINSGWNCMTCIYDELGDFNLYILNIDEGVLYSIVDGGNYSFDFKLW